MNPAAMRWFLLITALTIAAPYLLGARPRTRRQWFYVVVTIAFLAWVLPFMASLRAQDGLPLFRGNRLLSTLDGPAQQCARGRGEGRDDLDRHRSQSRGSAARPPDLKPVMPARW